MPTTDSFAVLISLFTSFTKLKRIFGLVDAVANCTWYHMRIGVIRINRTRQRCA